MPGVVEAYLKECRLINAVNVQSIIQNSYIADMAKYVTASETAKIMACFNSIPAQLIHDNRVILYEDYSIIMNELTTTYKRTLVEKSLLYN